MNGQNITKFLYKMMSRLIGENLKKRYSIFLKICNHDISKTITTRSFKLGQLIDDDE